jgi:hypothetical protein
VGLADEWTCFHEAAHAVVAEALGVPVLAIEGHDYQHAVTIVTDLPDTPENWHLQGVIAMAADAAIALRCGEAVAADREQMDEDGPDSDIAVARRHAINLVGEERAADKLLEFRVAARALLGEGEHMGAVDRVAIALRECKETRISGDDVRRLIANRPRPPA